MADEDKTAGKFTPDEVIAKQRNRQLLVLSVLIVVLAGFVFLTNRLKVDDSPLQEVMLVGGSVEEPGIDREAINEIEIWKGTDGERLVLNRVGDEWRVPARFNAPADNSNVDALLTQLFAAKRLSRAGTETESQFINYRLDDDQAAHLRVLGDKGEELLHVMVGRAETGTRNFVRLTGEDAPPGIFELTGAAGDFNTLYSALNLDSKGEPDARRWVSTRGFKVIPYDADVHTLTIKDADRELIFERVAGGEADDNWQLTYPHDAGAKGDEVRSVIDALRNYSAGDIAGRDTDAQQLGFMDTGREVRLIYRDESDVSSVRVMFGKGNDRNEVAVWIKPEGSGDYIYWAGDFILTRLFRAKSDFMQRERINPLPPGANVEHITVLEDGVATELARERQGAATRWNLTQPMKAQADTEEVNRLLTALTTLQGYRTKGEVDEAKLGVAPGVASRSITLKYPATPGRDRDSQDADDPPDAAEDDDPEDTAPEPPKHKTVTLYFGETSRGEVPMLRVTDQSREVFYLTESVLERLFRPAGEYARPESLGFVEEGWELAEVRVTAEGKLTVMTREAVAEGGGKRWMLRAPVEELANQGAASTLAAELKALAGIEQATLDKAAYGLGEGVSGRAIDLRLTKGEETNVVSLYLGAEKMGMTTLLVTRGGEEQFYLLRTNAADGLFGHILQDYDVRVRHVLISWEGLGVTLKQPGRTKEEARELAAQVLQRYRDGEDFVELQLEFNEDSADPTAVFDVSPLSNLVPEFKRLSARLEVDEAGIAESRFGFHVIKRIE